jgi:hypothetical protein
MNQSRYSDRVARTGTQEAHVQICWQTPEKGAASDQ